MKFTIKRICGCFKFPMPMDDYIDLRNKTPCCYCTYCGKTINSIYTYIIKTLERKKLLPDDFKPVCCYCWEDNNLVKTGEYITNNTGEYIIIT